MFSLNNHGLLFSSARACTFVPRKKPRECAEPALFVLTADRFYFDRTHKGNDWSAVKSRLSAEIASGKKSEKKATKEMLSLLKDKYTRWAGRKGNVLCTGACCGGSSCNAAVRFLSVRRRLSKAQECWLWSRPSELSCVLQNLCGAILLSL